MRAVPRPGRQGNWRTALTLAQLVAENEKQRAHIGELATLLLELEDSKVIWEGKEGRVRVTQVHAAGNEVVATLEVLATRKVPTPTGPVSPTSPVAGPAWVEPVPTVPHYPHPHKIMFQHQSINGMDWFGIEIEGVKRQIEWNVAANKATRDGQPVPINDAAEGQSIWIYASWFLHRRKHDGCWQVREFERVPTDA